MENLVSVITTESEPVYCYKARKFTHSINRYAVAVSGGWEFVTPKYGDGGPALHRGSLDHYNGSVFNSIVDAVKACHENHINVVAQFDKSWWALSDEEKSLIE